MAKVPTKLELNNYGKFTVVQREWERREENVLSYSAVLAEWKTCNIQTWYWFQASQKVRAAIEDLVDSQKADEEPNSRTKSWLRNTATKSLCRSLLNYGLISALPTRFTESQLNSISVLADEFISTRSVDQKPSTVILYRKAKRDLLACFGDIDIRELSKKHGREFFVWLRAEGGVKGTGLGENTAKQRLRYAGAFLELAIEDGLVRSNPFKCRGLSVNQRAAEKEYICWESVDRIIEYCPSIEWKLLFSLTRTISLRIPSEIRAMTWADVDWEQNHLLIHSPKTRRIGKLGRIVPIFETFR